MAHRAGERVITLLITDRAHGTAPGVPTPGLLSVPGGGGREAYEAATGTGVPLREKTLPGRHGAPMSGRMKRSAP